MALAFAALAAYLFAATAYSLLSGQEADSSPFGIAYLAVTAGVMFLLAHLKRATARAAHSAPLAAEASMTFHDGCLASGILVALALNTAFGLWWADPAAAALVALFCAREAVDTWREGSELGRRVTG